MKNNLLTLLLLLSAISTYAFVPDTIDQKYIHLFQSSFPKAETVIWQEYPETVGVNFTDAGIESRILYARDESYIRLTRYYNEMTMPYHFKHIAASRYSGKKIISVNEVSNIFKDGSVDVGYYLIMEDARNSWMIKMDANGTAEGVEKFKKNAPTK